MSDKYKPNQYNITVTYTSDDGSKIYPSYTLNVDGATFGGFSGTLPNTLSSQRGVEYFDRIDREFEERVASSKEDYSLAMQILRDIGVVK